jgi:hypothetical protein
LGAVVLEAEFIQRVRLDVLDVASRTGEVPDAVGIADRFGCRPNDVVDAFRQLAEAHVYVLEPGDPTRVVVPRTSSFTFDFWLLARGFT